MQPSRSSSVERVALVLLGVVALVPLIDLVLAGLASYGHDFHVYCSAAAAFLGGVNPYYVSNIGTTLPYVYPPLTLPFFAATCVPVWLVSGPVYLAYWAVLLVATFLLVGRFDPRFDPLLLAVILLAGYSATYWNVRTGNIGLVGAFLVALSFACLWTDRARWSAVPLAGLSAFKLFPAAFGAGYALLDRPLRERLVLVALPGALLGLFLAANLLLFPDLTQTYVRSITGQLSQHSPAGEGGGVSNPTLLFLVRSLVAAAGGGAIALSAVYAGFASVVLGLGWLHGRELPAPAAFGYGLLGLFLVIPRSKPYSFAYLLVPTYVLVRRLPRRRRIEAAFLVCVVATAVTRLQFDPPLFALYALDALRLRVVRQYGQALALLVFYLYLAEPTVAERVAAVRARLSGTS